MPPWEINQEIKNDFKRYISIYPQPIASSLTRLLASRNLPEWIDNCLKTAEIITRYIAACSVASFTIRANANSDGEKLDNFRSPRLDWGTFEHIVKQIAEKKIIHPLQTPLSVYSQEFNGVLDPTIRESPSFWISTLRDLRNELGHTLTGMSEPRARQILNDKKPIELLNNLLMRYYSLLSLPLIVIEEQSVDRGQYTALFLLLMGESYYPIPKEVILRNPVENKKHPYLVIDERIVDLYPFIAWDEIPKREYFGLLFIDSLSRTHVTYKSLDPDKHSINGETIKCLKKVMAGDPVVHETVVLSDVRTFVDLWDSELSQRIAVANTLIRQIPWDRCDPVILKWYADRISPHSTDPPQKTILNTLLPDRDSINPDEIRQILLLFGNEAEVSRQINRSVVEIRVREEDTGRISEQLPSRKNIIESLRFSIETFGRILGIENATIENLDTKTGTSDYIAMREALVNMFIHQDYGDNRAPAQVDISKKRILFYNLGYALTPLENLDEGGKSQSRNPLIANALRSIKFAELGGSGLRALKTSWERDNRRTPIITSRKEENNFSLALEKNIFDEFWKEALGVTLVPEEAILLQLIAGSTEVTLEQCITQTGFPPDNTFRMIRYLTTQALIDHIDGKYRVKEHVRRINTNRPS